MVRNRASGKHLWQGSSRRALEEAGSMARTPWRGNQSCTGIGPLDQPERMGYGPRTDKTLGALEIALQVCRTAACLALCRKAVAIVGGEPANQLDHADLPRMVAVLCIRSRVTSRQRHHKSHCPRTRNWPVRFASGRACRHSINKPTGCLRVWRRKANNRTRPKIYCADISDQPQSDRASARRSVGTHSACIPGPG
jgi:hypothetical protein